MNEVPDASPALDEIKRRFIGDPAYSNLPRKFKTAISGLQDVVHEINDVAFVGVEHPEHGPGLDLWVGGGLSTNPMLAERLGAWVPLDEVPEVWEGVVAIFRDYGYRRLRSKARLKFLIKDWGPEKFRQVLEDEYLKRKLIDGPAPVPPKHPIDHVGVTKLKNGLNAVGYSAVSGRLSDTVLYALADAVEAAGADNVRFTPYQKLVVVNVPDDKIAGLDAALEAVGLTSRAVALAPQPHRVHRLGVLQALLHRDPQPQPGAGTGDGEATGRAQRAARRADHHQLQRLPQLVRPRAGRRHRPQGPVDRRRQRPSGGGLQVHLGGALGFDSGFGRKLRQHKIYADDSIDYIERVVRNFIVGRNEGERFAEWAARADDAELQ